LVTNKRKNRELFLETFWDEQHDYLADYVDDGEKDWCVRPNMVFATSLPYVCLDEKKDYLFWREYNKSF